MTDSNSVNRYEVGAQDERPWGTWRVTDVGGRFTVKRITVKPGAKLSLQLHHGRDEHWIVVEGTAEVTRGDEVFTLQANQSVFIPVGTAHRIANPGPADLVFVEVQVGDRLDENDIVRIEDVYGRV